MPKKKCIQCGEMFEDTTQDNKPTSVKCPGCKPVLFDPMSKLNTPGTDDAFNWDTGWNPWDH